MKLKEKEKYRVTSNVGIIRDVICHKNFNSICGDQEVFECFSCIVNIDKSRSFEFYSKFCLTEKGLDSEYIVEPLKDEIAFIAFEDIYDKLFKNAEKVHLIAKLTGYSDDPIWDDKDENYLYEVIYLKIDDSFTEIVLSERADMNNPNFGIDYVYVAQYDFFEDLSLGILEQNSMAEVKYYNKDIVASKLCIERMEDAFYISSWGDMFPEDYMGVDLEEFLLYTFESEESNITYGSGTKSFDDNDFF